MSHLNSNYVSHSKPYVTESKDVKGKNVLADLEGTVEHTETVDVKDKIDTVTEDELLEQDTTETGIISGCSELNVREQPNTYAIVLCTLKENTEVIVEPIENEAWFHVYTPAGIEGYCMSNYVTILE